MRASSRGLVVVVGSIHIIYCEIFGYTEAYLKIGLCKSCTVISTVGEFQNIMKGFVQEELRLEGAVIILDIVTWCSIPGIAQVLTAAIGQLQSSVDVLSRVSLFEVPAHERDLLQKVKFHCKTFTRRVIWRSYSSTSTYKSSHIYNYYKRYIWIICIFRILTLNKI